MSKAEILEWIAKLTPEERDEVRRKLDEFDDEDLDYFEDDDLDDDVEEEEEEDEEY